MRDLLDLARARQGLGIRIAAREVDLADLCRTAAGELQDAHPGSAIALATRGDTRGIWDPERLGQVVTNLLSNALVHGGPAARVAVHVTGEADEVRLVVWNDGEPIPPARLARLAGGEGAAAGAEPTPGDSGLGLVIVREVVSAHGGTVEARSAVAEGTTFEVRLPRRTRAPGA